MILAAGAGAVALLELDAAAAGPFLLSRPFVVGPLMGWLCGDAWTGAALGAVFEALTLEELPLGGRLDFSAPVAAGTAAYLACAAAAPAEAAFLAGIGAGWAHAKLEGRLRRGRGERVTGIEAAVAAGRPPRLGAEIFSALVLQAAATFALALAAFAALGPALARLWPLLPGFLRAGARASFLAAPWIGAGSLGASMWRRG